VTPAVLLHETIPRRASRRESPTTLGTRSAALARTVPRPRAAALAPAAVSRAPLFLHRRAQA